MSALRPSRSSACYFRQPESGRSEFPQSLGRFRTFRAGPVRPRSNSRVDEVHLEALGRVLRGHSSITSGPSAP